MATPLAVQTTAQGILIPRAAFQDWGEVEVLREKDRIVIQPKSPVPVQEREAITQALGEAGLLDEPEAETDLPVILDEPETDHPNSLDQIVDEMKAAGLVEDLSWTQPPLVSSEERARLAKK
jgi:hypothetical protein